MKRLTMWLLDLLYPNLCDCCGKRIAYHEAICADCRAALQTLTVSEDIQRENAAWDGVTAAYYYRNQAKNGVLSLKDGARGFLTEAAEVLAAQIKAQFPHIDCITFVPITKRRRAMQGYGHTELLAKALGKQLHLPVRSDLLYEDNRSKLRQHMLSPADRKSYAKRFKSNPVDLTGKTILLCDDVLTTGSTLNVCISALRECGAVSVFAAVLTVRGHELQDIKK